MPRTKLFFNTLTTSLALSLGLFTALLPAVAQYVPPAGLGLPGRREGAGTRGTCITGGKPLMPLVPQDSFGLTTSDRPSFFWYVPRTVNPITGTTVPKQAEFVVLDENDQELYDATLPLSGNAGIVSFTLPANAVPNLKANQNYRWQFSIICDANNPSMNPFVEGIFQQVRPTPALVSIINRAAPSDRPNIYARSGIWYDSISTLASLRCTKPSDTTLANYWNNLLTSVDLGSFSQEPIVQSCLPISEKQGDSSVKATQLLSAPSTMPTPGPEN